MYENEKIDVLMATYNGEKFLREQIESILKQSYSNIRLIISDDCSTDNTREILKEYEQKDDRIKVFFQEKNLGYVKNFEFLLKQVENNYYMLSDQDDVWLPKKIEHAYKTIKENNSCMAFSDLIVVDENLNTLEESFLKYHKLHKKVQKFNDFRRFYLYNCVTGCTVIGKKEIIEEIVPIPLDTKYVIHDYWIALICEAKGKVAYIKEKDILYRQHGNNCVGYSGKPQKKDSIYNLRNKIINIKIEQFELLDKYKYKFTEKMQKENERALKYFKRIKNLKYINLNIKDFHKIYKYERLSFYIKSCILLNLNIWRKK